MFVVIGVELCEDIVDGLGGWWKEEYFCYFYDGSNVCLIFGYIFYAFFLILQNIIIISII
jgi:hypothetical protein